ncbi:hypothetical protein [Desulfoluna spongiiphila]|uniref:Uncharacterized protein n=1 Tax=Desulfoluna spongiiphila TaxID=419481 RepID=A0A1G5IC96_9BACT|nr:hypothetical protein [Desulfoluna spongiiphila]SCY73765.1 hypothetical protein SAMN05216233_11917 [Desulfoluna spongiiphila]
MQSSLDLDTIWSEAVKGAKDLGLDGLHVKVMGATTEAVFFDRRWCAGNVIPFMTGEEEPGYLAGFAETVGDGIRVELLFEKGRRIPAESMLRKRIVFLKGLIVTRMSQFGFSKNQKNAWGSSWLYDTL